MGRYLGEEATRGQSMTEQEFTLVWQVLAEQPRRVLWQLARRLSVGLNDHTHEAGRVAADVSFGVVDGSIESVHGPNLETVLAKAVALAIDRRLAAIVRARAGIDRVTDTVTDARLVLGLERLVLRATTPADFSGTTPTDTTPKVGERP